MSVNKVSNSNMSDNWFISNNLINNLFHLNTVQLLKEINLDDIDTSVAWQYGHYYNTPWKDCWHTASLFRSYHLPVLYAYVIDKCIAAIKETATYVINCMSVDVNTKMKLLHQLINKKISREDFFNSYYGESSSIRFLGLTGAFVDQVDVVLQSGKLLKNVSKAHGGVINDRYIGNLKQVCSRIEMLDKMAILQWNNLGNEQIVTSGEDSYLRRDQIQDLLEIVNVLCESMCGRNAFNSSTAISHRDLHFDTIRTMAYILSLLLHTFYLPSYRPERMEDLYSKIISRKTQFMDYITFIREFTNNTFGYIVHMPFDIIQSGYCPNHPENRNENRPHSLYERYLVLRFMYLKSHAIDSSYSYA